MWAFSPVIVNGRSVRMVSANHIGTASGNPMSLKLWVSKYGSYGAFYSFASDLVATKTNGIEEPVHGDLVVVQVERGSYNRGLCHDVNGVRLCSANPKFKDILIADTTDWEIRGKVIYSIRFP